MIYSCRNCHTVRTFGTVHSLLVHVRIRHAHEPGFSIICGLNGCHKQYSSYYLFRKHVGRKHNDLLCSSSGQQVCSDDDQDMTCNINENEVSDSESTDQYISGVDRLQEIEQTFSHSLARSILKCREEHNIPISVQNTITSEVKDLVESYQQNVNSEIKNHLISKGYNVHEDSELCALLDSDKQISNIFKNVSSEHMLKSFCKSSLNFIEPTQVVLEHGKFHFISICEILTALLRNDEVLEIWHANQLSQDGVLRDYCDGAYFREHALFSEYPRAVRLHLYIDEFEVCNPISARRGLHKLTSVYFTIGNLPTKFRSKQKFIFLTLIAKHSLVKEYKYDCVFEPLVRDLKHLETVGVCDKNGVVYKGAVATISADNLSAHAVAGFRQSFSNGRICRFCMARKEDIADKFSENDFVLRSENVHNYHIHEVSLNSGNVSIYGVAGVCVFSQLNYFSVTKCFPADIMHDCLEGAIPFTLELILARLREGNSHLYEQINANLQSFAFTEADKVSRPPLIKANGSLIGTASQKWCMLRILPFILPEVPVTHEVWELYSLLREIVAIIFSPSVHISSLAYLETLIHQHNSLLHSLFPDVNIPPKVHYLIHYPRLLFAFGPLRHLWCMRFESKHLYFKRLAESCHNFKNISKTLSTRHQFLQCYQLSGESLFGNGCDLPQCGETVHITQMPYSLRMVLPQNHDTFWSVVKCKAQYIKYACKQVLLVDYIHGEDVPVFMAIEKILYVAHEEQFYLCGFIYQSLAFCSKYHAYRVKKTGDWLVLKPGEEHESQGMQMYCVTDLTYVVMQFTCLP